MVVVCSWLFVPQGDFFAGNDQNAIEQIQAREDVDAKINELIEAIEDNPLLAEQMEDTLDGLKGDDILLPLLRFGERQFARSPRCKIVWRRCSMVKKRIWKSPFVRILRV